MAERLVTTAPNSPVAKNIRFEVAHVSPQNQSNHANKLHTFKKDDGKLMVERFQSNVRQDPRLVAAMTRHATTHSDSRNEECLQRASVRQPGREQANYIQRIQHLQSKQRICQSRLQEYELNSNADSVRIRELVDEVQRMRNDNVQLAEALKQAQEQNIERARNSRGVSISTLEDEMRRKAQLCDSLALQIEEAKMQLHHLESDRNQLRLYIESEQNKMSQFHSYLSKLEMENDRLNRLIEDYKQNSIMLNEQLLKRQQNQKEALKQLERYSEVLRGKELEISQLSLRMSTGRDRSLSLQENRTGNQGMVQKLMAEMDKLNQVILCKNKELFELKNTRIGTDGNLSLELKNCKIQLKNYEELLSKRGGEIVRLEALLRSKEESQHETSISRTEVFSRSGQIMIDLEQTQEQLTARQAQLSKYKQQISALNNHQSQILRENEILKQQLQSTNFQLDSANQASRNKCQNLQQKFADLQRKHRQSESQLREELAQLEREKNVLKMAEADKIQRLRCLEVQFRDTNLTLDNERKQFLKIRKAYEQKIANLDHHRLELERRFNQMAYDLEMKESQMNRIKNIGRTTSQQLEFVTNESQQRKQIIEYLENQLERVNGEYRCAKEEADLLRANNIKSQTQVKELEERLQQQITQRMPQPTLKKVRSATTQNFLTRASESSEMRQASIINQKSESNSPMKHIGTLPLYTLPQMSQRSDIDQIEVETLRRQNRVIKTVMSENEELQAQVILYEQRLKTLSKEEEFNNEMERQLKRLTNQNIFLKKVTAKRQPYEQMLHQQEKKIKNYEKQMSDALNENLVLKGRCSQYESKIRDFQRETRDGKRSISEMVPNNEPASEERIAYLKKNNAELESRVFDLLRINSQLKVQAENKGAETSKGVLDFYRQQAQIAQDKISHLEGLVRRSNEQTKLLHRELNSYRNQAERQTARNGQLNTTIHTLNVQLGMVKNDRYTSQTDLSDILGDKKLKKHLYTSSGDLSSSIGVSNKTSRLE